MVTLLMYGDSKAIEIAERMIWEAVDNKWVLAQEKGMTDWVAGAAACRAFASLWLLAQEMGMTDWAAGGAARRVLSSSLYSLLSLL